MLLGYQLLTIDGEPDIKLLSDLGEYCYTNHSFLIWNMITKSGAKICEKRVGVIYNIFSETFIASISHFTLSYTITCPPFPTNSFHWSHSNCLIACIRIKYESSKGRKKIEANVIFEPPHGKTSYLHRRKQRCRSASQ